MLKFYKHLHIICLLVAFASLSVSAQKKTIEIRPTGAFGEVDEEKYPGAKILTRSEAGQVHVFHDGIDLWCDQAIIYSNEDFVEAYGNVLMKQGDTINMVSKYAEYSGKTQLAYAKGEVVLTEPSSVLKTDKLYFDRVKQESYYNTGGEVVRDTSGTITSTVGRYYMTTKKYRFLNKVVLVNPEYTLNTKQLDFYSESGHAYMYGPSTIEDKTSKIYCERGFYNTNNDTGYFIKNSRIDYENRIFEGDSMYFDRNTSFASATNNIKVTDTINNSIIKGHYAEVFREKDSVFITKRALAISVQEKDSVYLHADTLMVTGKPEHRITRAYRNGKIYKSDMSGKADSIHMDQKTGLTKFINLGKLDLKDAFSVSRKPILWNVGNQMTGDTIHLKSNPETEKLDSLIVFNNAFLISKDSLSQDGYNQISGKRLIGLFNEDNKLKQANIYKNSQSIIYARNDVNELIGIDKAKSANIEMYFENGDILEYRRLIQSEGETFPEAKLPKKERKLRGFDWRDSERPKNIEDLFKDDPPFVPVKIKGLDPFVPEEEFFDEALLKRVEAADKAAKPKARVGDEEEEPSKASRQIPDEVKEKQNLGRRRKGSKKRSKLVIPVTDQDDG